MRQVCECDRVRQARVDVLEQHCQVLSQSIQHLAKHIPHDEQDSTLILHEVTAKTQEGLTR